jgi:ribosome-associated translation inhibitor RaiA
MFQMHDKEIKSMDQQDQQIETQIRYVNVEPSAALDRFIQNHMQTLLERVSVHPKKYSLSMTIKANAKNAQGKIKSFEVDGTFKIARRANLRAAEKMGNVQKAVVSVIKSLEKQIRRLSEKKERSRKTIGKSLKSVRNFKSKAFSDSMESPLSFKS